MRLSALIVAAGRGTRVGGPLPKQYADLAGRPVLARSIALFQSRTDIAQVVIVIHPDDRALFDTCVRPHLAGPVTLADGGATRAASVLAGLAVCDGTHILVHDAARPLASDGLIGRVIAALSDAPGTATGAAPGLAVTDALWRGAEGRVLGSLSRDGLYRAQTPQGFSREDLLAAHALPGAAQAADDVAAALAAGLDVRIVDGEETNLKITRPEDFARAAQLLKENRLDIRVGNGFDVHRFGPGSSVVLCGVAVPYGRGLQGHSDADVGMHAITDAIYGALSLGDIGQHFPPSDPQWKGAASEIFLRHAVQAARTCGFALSNADCTLICEHPKIGPHAEAMRMALARIMDAEVDRISVKATTSERLGFTGREEGIAAMATVALVRT